MYKLKKGSFIYATLIIPLSVISIFLFKYFDFEKWAYYYSVFLIITICIQIYLLNKYINIISFAGLFFILANLFHFGSIVVIGFDATEIKKLSVIYLYGLDLNQVKVTVTFCYIAMLLVVLGILIASGKKKDVQTKPNIAPKSTLYMGLIFVLLFFPVSMLYLKSRLLLFLQGGYLNTFNEVGDGGGFINTLIWFAYYGLYLVLVYFSSRNKPMAYLLLLSCMIYSVLYIFIGQRGFAVLLLLFYLYIAYRCNLFKINISNIILISIGAYLFMIVLVVVASYRNDGINSFSEVLPTVASNISITPLFLLLNEMGGTVYTPYLSIVQAGQIYEIDYGLTYIKGLISILPNINGLFTTIINQAFFSKILIGNAIGGSFIGEAFFNFGYGSLIVMIFIGIFIGKTSQKIEDDLFEGKYKKIIVLIPIFVIGLWWVRNVIFGIYRHVIYGYFMVEIVECLLKYSGFRKNITSDIKHGRIK
jgi:hypothetical protein